MKNSMLGDHESAGQGGGQGDPRRGSTSTSTPARCTPSWGRTGRARARWRASSPGIPSTRSPAARSMYDGQGPARDGSGGARARGRVPGVPVPGRDPRREQHLLPQGRAQRHPQASRRAGARRDGVPAAGQGEDEAARHRPELLNRAVNEGFSGGEKKRNEIFQMARARAEAGDPRRDRLRARHRRAQDRGQRRERAAQPGARDRRRHALPAAARTTSCPTTCTC